MESRSKRWSTALAVALAIHIHKQIREPWPEGGRTPVRRVLKQWCRRRAYLRALARGGHRLNLDGSPDQSVSEAHWQVARTQLGRRR